MVNWLARFRFFEINSEIKTQIGNSLKFLMSVGVVFYLSAFFELFPAFVFLTVFSFMAWTEFKKIYKDVLLYNSDKVLTPVQKSILEIVKSSIEKQSFMIKYNSYPYLDKKPLLSYRRFMTIVFTDDQYCLGINFSPSKDKTLIDREIVVYDSKLEQDPVDVSSCYSVYLHREIEKAILDRFTNKSTAAINYSMEEYVNMKKRLQASGKDKNPIDLSPMLMKYQGSGSKRC